MKKHSAFTLIEMLIVIVIIGILAAALIPRLQSVQWRARDTKRKADITQIHNAILIYSTDNGKYPQSLNASWTCALDNNCYRFSYDNSSWITLISGYMTTIPQDPINNWIQAWNTDTIYSYAYGNIWQQQKTFVLLAKLENKTDPDRCEIQDVKLFIGSTISCKASVWCATYCPYLYARTDINGN